MFMYRLVHDTGASEVMRSRITRRSDVSARETRATVDGRLCSFTSILFYVHFIVYLFYLTHV